MGKLIRNRRKMPGGGESYDVIHTGPLPERKTALTHEERRQIAELKAEFSRRYPGFAP